MGTDLIIKHGKKDVAFMGRLNHYYFSTDLSSSEMSSVLNQKSCDAIQQFLVIFPVAIDNDERMYLLKELQDELEKVGRSQALVTLLDKYSYLKAEISC